MPQRRHPKPAESAESQLLGAILNGRYPIDGILPGERELALQLGVTRPTLREVLQRLARDGWLNIQHGKPTRVRNYWQEGNLAVLSAMAQTPHRSALDFVTAVLEARVLLAPAYTRQALERAPGEVAALLAEYETLPDDPVALAHADWDLHQQLARRAANPIFPLVLNSFADLVPTLSVRYFALADCREHSRAFYGALRRLAEETDAGSKHSVAQAEDLVCQVMQASVALWIRVNQA